MSALLRPSLCDSLTVRVSLCTELLSAGVVGLPYAFFHAGAVVSCVCLFLATIMAWITMGYIVEVCAWCQGWISEGELSEEERCATIVDDADSVNGGGPKRRAGVHLFQIGIRSYELTELCGTFLDICVSEDSCLRPLCNKQGKLPVVRLCVELLVCANIMISCWLYVSVFSSSLSIIVPLPLGNKPQDVSKCMQVCNQLDEAACVASDCVWGNGTCIKGPELESYCISSYSVFAWGFGIIMAGILCIDVSALTSVQGVHFSSPLSLYLYGLSVWT